MKLFAIVVLYKMLAADSPTVRSLSMVSSQRIRTDVELSILIWDNTPGGQLPGDLPSGMRYHSAPHNPGLSAAYNSAVATALNDGAEWFLTLDQDTILPDNFVDDLSRVISAIDTQTEVAAIVPRVIGDGRELSPFRFMFNTIPCWFAGSINGVSKHAVYAVNSAATVRIQALCRVQGYNPLFPLDISDLDLFHRLAQTGYAVYIAGDLVVSHEFSLLKKHKRMSLARYDAQLLDECAFWDLSMGWLARLERLVRLSGRVWKDHSNVEARAFKDRTIAEIKRRLLTPRKRRIADWLSRANERAAKNGSGRLQCEARASAQLEGKLD